MHHQTSATPATAAHAPTVRMRRVEGLGVIDATIGNQKFGAVLDTGTHNLIDAELAGAAGDSGVRLGLSGGAVSAAAHRFGKWHRDHGLRLRIAPQQLATAGHMVIVDFPRGVVELLRKADAERLTAGAGRVPSAQIERCPGKDRRFVVAAKMDGIVARLLVDTGSKETLLDAQSEPAKALRSKKEVLGMAQRQGRDSPTNVEVLKGEVAFELGPLGGAYSPLLEQEFASRGGCAYDGVLGLDMLQHCVLAMDADVLQMRCKG